MFTLKDLEPKEVWHFFEAICDLPHGSRNTKLLSDYCMIFARIRGLWCQQDKLGNVIIRKEASPGYEDHPTVIIQGHLDMVCEKVSGHNIDFRRDGLSIYVEDDYVRAKGTTLGGDDGVAVAFALALLDNKNLVHPPLEIVLTVDEELGMIGASALDTSPLKGNILINIDSDIEGVLIAGCAGGATSTLSVPLKRENVTGIPYTLCVEGLQGGHSGMEIGSGRTNAIMYIASLYEKLCETYDLRLYGFTGGGKDNAIPRNATIKFISAQPLGEEVEGLLASSMEALRETEPSAVISIKSGDQTSLGALTKAANDRVRAFFSRVPNGIVAMCEDAPDLPETSLNLGIISFEKTLTATFSLRSSVNAKRQELAKRLKKLVGELGGQYREEGAYPAWEYRPKSRLREVMQQVWKEQNGRDARVEIIHAGLECGILSSKIPDLDCVSFGPHMLAIHTPDEALSISSTARTWNYLLEILKKL